MMLLFMTKKMAILKLQHFNLCKNERTTLGFSQKEESLELFCCTLLLI